MGGGGVGGGGDCRECSEGRVMAVFPSAKSRSVGTRGVRG